MFISAYFRRKLKIFISPFIFFIIVFNFLPLIYMIIMGFMNWELQNQGFDFVWLNNFIEIFKNQEYQNAFMMTLFYMIVPVFFQMIIGCFLAFLLYFVRSRLKNMFRSLIIIPMVIPPVVAGMIWRILFLPTFGGINHYLSKIGLPKVDWLGDPLAAPFSILIANSWQWIPFVTLLILASLESLPKEPYEAAKVDGATGFQRIRFIILPLLKPAMFVVAVFRTIEGLKVFPYIYTMTSGGPGTATQEMGFLTYVQAFRYFKISYSAAISTTILLIALCLTGILKKIGGGLNEL